MLLPSFWRSGKRGSDNGECIVLKKPSKMTEDIYMRDQKHNKNIFDFSVLCTYKNTSNWINQISYI